VGILVGHTVTHGVALGLWEGTGSGGALCGGLLVDEHIFKRLILSAKKT